MGLSLLVTGAGGFLGRAVVSAGLARGHAVQAVLRRPVPLAEGAITRLHDLRDGPPDLSGIDAVIHCAASLTGDDASQQQDTVEPTRRLIDTIMAQPHPPRLVLVSSLAVYDHGPLRPGDMVSEATGLQAKGQTPYARAKIAQEALAGTLPQCWLARPGLIYGPGRTWNDHVGAGVGPLLLRIGTTGELPLIHVSDCADALVRAAETPVAGAKPLNLVGDDRPDRSRFIAAHRVSGWPRLVLPFPWPILLGLGKLLAPLPGLPGLLRPAILKSRMMPLRYSNEAARSALGWTPQIPFEAGMATALEGAR